MVCGRYSSPLMMLNEKYGRFPVDFTGIGILLYIFKEKNNVMYVCG